MFFKLFPNIADIHGHGNHVLSNKIPREVEVVIKVDNLDMISNKMGSSSLRK